MSLLMEAIRRAEEAKRHAGAQGASGKAAHVEAPPPPRPSIDARASDSPDSSGSPVDLPALAPRLDGDDDGPAPPPAGPARPRPFAAEDAAREHYAAGNVFAAKQAPEAGGRLWWIGGGGLLALLAVGGYYGWQWWTVHPSGGWTVQPSGEWAVQPPGGWAVQPPAVAPIPAPALPAAISPATPSAASTFSSSAPLAEEESGIVPPPPETAPPLPSFPPPSPPLAAAPSPPERAPASAAPRHRPGGETPRLIRAPARANLALERAYEALQSGRDEDARRAYQEVLRADGKNTDALLGLATLAARRGRADEARGYYLRALEADPTDATARAGVLGTGKQADERDAENLLERALARQPGSPPLLFALGNLYARQLRWSEAQQAYFQAHAGAPDEPDIIFNLAVSLDHLRQRRLAAQYYRMALAAGAGRTAAFDRAAVNARLSELQP